MGFRIAGTGSSVPKLTVTNEDLSKFLDTSDEWISTRTGIRQRRIMVEETTLSLAVEASKKALDSAGITAEELDVIIFSTLQGDLISPSASCLLSGEIGAKNAKVFDINVGCCGFIYALEMADTYFDANKAEKILVVSGESMSRLTDWTDRSTCVLFGDGAGAVILEKSDSKCYIGLTVNGSAEHLYVPGSGGNSPFKSIGDESSFVYMNGQEIYKFAVSAIVSDIRKALKATGLDQDDISYYLLHQANLRIIESAQARLKQPDARFPHNIENYGNMSSASIPVLLDELHKSGKLKNGDKLVMSAFGAGLATGVCITKWQEVKK